MPVFKRLFVSFWSRPVPAPILVGNMHKAFDKFLGPYRVLSTTNGKHLANTGVENPAEQGPKSLSQRPASQQTQTGGPSQQSQQSQQAKQPVAVEGTIVAANMALGDALCFPFTLSPAAAALAACPPGPATAGGSRKRRRDGDESDSDSDGGGAAAARKAARSAGGPLGSILVLPAVAAAHAGNAMGDARPSSAGEAQKPQTGKFFAYILQPIILSLMLDFCSEIVRDIAPLPIACCFRKTVNS